MWQANLRDLRAQRDANGFSSRSLEQDLGLGIDKAAEHSFAADSAGAERAEEKENWLAAIDLLKEEWNEFENRRSAVWKEAIAPRLFYGLPACASYKLNEEEQEDWIFLRQGQQMRDEAGLSYCVLRDYLLPPLSAEYRADEGMTKIYSWGIHLSEIPEQVAPSFLALQGSDAWSIYSLLKTGRLKMLLCLKYREAEIVPEREEKENIIEEELIWNFVAQRPQWKHIGTPATWDALREFWHMPEFWCGVEVHWEKSLAKIFTKIQLENTKNANAQGNTDNSKISLELRLEYIDGLDKKDPYEITENKAEAQSARSTFLHGNWSFSWRYFFVSLEEEVEWHSHNIGEQAHRIPIHLPKKRKLLGAGKIWAGLSQKNKEHKEFSLCTKASDDFLGITSAEAKSPIKNSLCAQLYWEKEKAFLHLETQQKTEQGAQQKIWQEKRSKDESKEETNNTHALDIRNYRLWGSAPMGYKEKPGSFLYAAPGELSERSSLSAEWGLEKYYPMAESLEPKYWPEIEALLFEWQGGSRESALAEWITSVYAPWTLGCQIQEDISWLRINANQWKPQIKWKLFWQRPLSESRDPRVARNQDSQERQGILEQRGIILAYEEFFNEFWRKERKTANAKLRVDRV
jgi:hypothetical protein